MRLPQTVFELIERQADERPTAVYAIGAEHKQSITYVDLCDSCDKVSVGLATLGMSRGDTVSVVMSNGLQTLRLLLGAMHAGYCVNPVNLLAQPEQMRYVLDHSDCRVVVTSPEWIARVQAALEEVDRNVQVVVLAVDGDPEALRVAFDRVAGPAEGMKRPDRLPPDANSVALLMYTSGTTGLPKGVMLTHANLVANATAISQEHGLCSDDRVLAVLPLYHVNAVVVTMLAPLAHGGSLAMPAKFSAAMFWPQAIDLRCTWLNVVPTIISYLLEGAAPRRASLGSIRFCRSASAALPPEHHRAFEEKFGITIIETMGLTETAAPAFSNPLDPERRKTGSVGRASGGEAGIVDALLVPVADEVTGEIVIRGPHVMRGYYKNPEATRASLTPDGWLRTGDLGHRDADGFFYVTGRIKELIIKGGENIAPREIDEVLLSHPAVLEVAAVGVPDRHYGQEILACVVLREGTACTADELTAYCVQRLGSYKTPCAFRFVKDLPRGPSGKVQRLKLVDLASARVD